MIEPLQYLEDVQRHLLRQRRHSREAQSLHFSFYSAFNFDDIQYWYRFPLTKFERVEFETQQKHLFSPIESDTTKKILWFTLNRVRQAFRFLERPWEHYVVFGTFPLRNANAQALRTPAGNYAIVFNSALFPVICAVAEAVSACADVKIRDDGVILRTMPNRKTSERITANEFANSHFVNALKSYSQSGTAEGISGQIRQDEERQTIDITNILIQSAALFVMTHELGHIYFGHLSEAWKSPAENEKERRDLLWNREFECDRLAVDSTLAYNVRSKTTDMALGYMGVEFAFSALSVLSRLNIADDSYTHPPLAKRLEAARSVLQKQVSPQLFELCCDTANDISEILEVLWENNRQVLQQSVTGEVHEESSNPSFLVTLGAFKISPHHLLAVEHSIDGDYKSAADHALRAAESLNMTDVVPDSGRTDHRRMRAWKFAAEMFQKTGDPRGHMALEKALAAVAPDTDPELWAELKYELAETLFSDARYADYIIEVTLVMEKLERKLGAFDLKLTRYLRTIAIVQCILGDYEEAWSAIARAIGNVQKALEGYSCVLADLYGIVAAICEKTGEHENQKDALLSSLQIYTNCYGADSPSVALVGRQLGVFFRALGAHKAARGAYEAALQIDRRVFGTDNLEIASDCCCLGAIHSASGSYAEAAGYFRRGLSIFEALRGSAHPDLIPALNGLAYALAKQSRCADAISLYERAIRICQTAFSDSHPTMAALLQNLGAAYLDQKESGRASTQLKKALRIVGDNVGQNHPDYARVCGNLAAAYIESGVYDEAEKLLQKALEIERLHLSPTHPRLAIRLSNLGALARKSGRLELAKEHATDACRIFFKWSYFNGDSHEAFQSTITNLIDVLLASGLSNEVAAEFVKDLTSASRAEAQNEANALASNPEPPSNSDC